MVSTIAGKIPTWVSMGLAACATLLLVATPADAKRKFGFSSSKSSSTSPSGAGSKAAPPAKMSAIDIALIGMQVQRATSNKLRKVFELPPTKANTLPDDRHIHIGEVTRFLLGGRYVGWISRREFVELSRDHLAALLDSAGFDSVAAFEKHLAEVGPTKDTAGAAADKADADAPAGAAAGEAEPAAGYSSIQLAILATGALSLLGVFGFCFMSWRSNRESDHKSATAVTAVGRGTRTTRVSLPTSRVATPAAVAPRPARVAQAAPAAAPAEKAERSSTIPRRAPRNLGTLVTKPA